MPREHKGPPPPIFPSDVSPEQAKRRWEEIEERNGTCKLQDVVDSFKAEGLHTTVMSVSRWRRAGWRKAPTQVPKIVKRIKNKLDSVLKEDPTLSQESRAFMAGATACATLVAQCEAMTDDQLIREASRRLHASTIALLHMVDQRAPELVASKPKEVGQLVKLLADAVKLGNDGYERVLSLRERAMKLIPPTEDEDLGDKPRANSAGNGAGTVIDNEDPLASTLDAWDRVARPTLGVKK